MATATYSLNGFTSLVIDPIRDPVRDGLVVATNAGKAALLRHAAVKTGEEAGKDVAADTVEAGAGSMARSALGAGAGVVAGGLIVAYDVHKAKPEEKKWVLGKETASTGTAIVVGVVSGGFLLPVAAFMAVAGTGYLVENEYKGLKRESAHAAAMSQIKPDLAGNANLQGIADTMDQATQAAKAYRTAHGMDVPAGDFVRNAQGHIDIHDATNQTFLKQYIDDQRAKTGRAAIELDQLSILPAAMKNADKEKAQFALEETKKRLDLASLELSTSRIKSGSPTLVPANEMDSVPDKVSKSPDSQIFRYTIRKNTLSVVGDEHLPTPSRQVLDMYQKTKGPVREVLYRKVHGKDVAYATNDYYITDDNDPIASQRAAMAAMIGPVAGAYAAPLPTPAKAKGKETHAQSNTVPAH